MSKTVVALFKSINEAQSAKSQLITQGYKAEDISVVSNDGNSSPKGGYTAGSTGENTSETGVIASIKNFFGSLSDAGEHDQQYYAQGISKGGALLSATVPENRADATITLLEEYGATDFEDGSVNKSARQLGSQVTTADATGSVAIPVVEEELQVGKREVNRGGVRVFSRVVETPIEENVQLREEHVRVQRRPVDRLASEADFQAFQEGSIELTETSEEAVVSKQARVVEEVVVGKDVTERTQVVKDKLRQTKVEVEELAPEAKKTTSSGR